MRAAITSTTLAGKNIYASSITDLLSKEEVTDRYKTYLAINVEPDEQGHNRFNLFDDLDCLDREHLLAVLKFIKMRKPSWQMQ